MCAGTPPGTVQLLTPSTQLTPQSSEHVDLSQSDAMKYKGNESEPEEAANISEDGMKKMDPLENFLPPPPNTKCSDELQVSLCQVVKFNDCKVSWSSISVSPDFHCYIIFFLHKMQGLNKKI